MKYYGVAVGSETGVFPSWDLVLPLVKGYKGAKYKAFPTQEEAEAYVRSGGVDNKVQDAKGHSTIQSTDKTCKIYVGVKKQEEEGKFRVSASLGGFKETVELNSWSWLSDYPAEDLTDLGMKCYGYVHALKEAYKKGYRDFVIVFKEDSFEGWGNSWKAKSEPAKYYKSCLGILKNRDGVSIRFEKLDKGEHYHLEYLVKKNLDLGNKSDEFEVFGWTGSL